MRFSARFLLAGFLVTAVWPGAVRGEKTAVCAVRAVQWSGDRLLLVIGTSIVTEHFYSHGGSGSEVHNYFAEIDLAKPGPLSEKTRLIGPLWGKDDKSFLRVQSYPFSPAAMKEGIETIAARFEADGRFVWLKWDDRQKNWRRLALNLESGPPHWTEVGRVKPIPELPYLGLNRKRVTSASGGMVAQLEPDDAVRIYNTTDGDEISDSWLSRALHVLMHREDLDNSQLTLTEDLNHLVCWPAPTYAVGNLGPPANVVLRTFVFDGKPYDRSQFYLASSRPESAPRMFRKFFVDGLTGVFLNAFSIGGEPLLLLSGQDGKKVLVDSKPAIKFQVEARGWGPGKNDSAEERIDFAGPFSASPLHLESWYYRQQRWVSREVDFRSLFKSNWLNGQLEPLHCEAVKE